MLKKPIVRIHIFAITLITFLCCFHIRALDYICVLNDEFGYWAHAVSATGYNWKELIAETPYYSWGYSLFLIPITIIFPTPTLWYKAAILLNTVFLLLSYYFCYQCGRKLFPAINDKVLALISLIVIIYPSNILNTQITWTETLSYLLVWINIYLLILLENRFSNKYFIMIIIVSLYSYAVHKRNIGIMLTNFFIVILLLIKHKKNIFHYFLLPLLLICGYHGIELLNTHQINSLWGNSQTSSLNNVSVNTETITSYASRFTQNSGNLFSSMLGKLMYLLIAFEFTFPITIICFFKDMCANLKEKCIFKNYIVSKLAILLVAAAMFGICSLQMNYWQGRKDYIVYARYMENALGPLLLLSIAETLLYIREAKLSLYITFTLLLIGYIPLFYCINNANGGFVYICSPIIGGFYKLFDNTTQTFTLLAIILIAIFIMLCIGIYSKKAKQRMALLLLCFGFTYSLDGCLLTHLQAQGQSGYSSLRTPICDAISDTALQQYPIYYVKNSELDPTSCNPKYIQYMVPDRTIYVTSLEELETNFQPNAIILTYEDNENTRNFLTDKGAELLVSNYLLCVYKT